MERGYRVTMFNTDPLTRDLAVIPRRVGVWPERPRSDGLLIADFLTDDHGAAPLIELAHSLELRCAVTFDHDDGRKFVIVEVMGPSAVVNGAIVREAYERLRDYRRDAAPAGTRMLHLPRGPGTPRGPM